MKELHVKIREERLDLQKKRILVSIPYSPDLASSDLWLLSHLKQFMYGKQFLLNEDVIGAVDNLPDSHFGYGIHKLDHSNKYIKISGTVY